MFKERCNTDFSFNKNYSLKNNNIRNVFFQKIKNLKTQLALFIEKLILAFLLADLSWVAVVKLASAGFSDPEVKLPVGKQPEGDFVLIGRKVSPC